jgi:hypothetical protein
MIRKEWPLYREAFSLFDSFSLFDAFGLCDIRLTASGEHGGGAKRTGTFSNWLATGSFGKEIS